MAPPRPKPTGKGGGGRSIPRSLGLGAGRSRLDPRSRRSPGPWANMFLIDFTDYHLAPSGYCPKTCPGEPPRCATVARRLETSAVSPASGVARAGARGRALYSYVHVVLPAASVTMGRAAGEPNPAGSHQSLPCESCAGCPGVPPKLLAPLRNNNGLWLGPLLVTTLLCCRP